MSFYARRKLDISWGDLGYALSALLRPTVELDRKISAALNWENQSIVTLSVRSGLDLMLRALALPRGSEVLMTAVTIRDMARIVELHELVPVPVDISPETLEPSIESLKAAYTSRTRAIVVSPLFGARCEMQGIVEFARARNLLVIEDLAQAYCGSECLGHPESDAVMLSFGPIKTRTALGGGVLRIKSETLRAKMAELQSQYPAQTMVSFVRRLFKFALLKAISQPDLYGIFVAALGLLGIDYDRFIGRSARAFEGGDLLTKLRHRPCAPLLALLLRRLKNFGATDFRARADSGWAFAEALGPHALVAGAANKTHTFWVFALLCPSPDQLVRKLAAVGFDATRGASNLCFIAVPDGHSAPWPINAQRMLEQIVYLPLYPELPLPARGALLDALRSSLVPKGQSADKLQFSQAGR